MVEIRNLDLSGSIRPVLGWLHYTDHRMAPLARSLGGFIKAIIKWLYIGGQ